MTAPLPNAREYWATLTADRDVSSSKAAFLGDGLQRWTVRHFDSIADSGVLESLVGSSALTNVGMVGRIHLADDHPERFRMDISPAFNTWHVEYDRRPSDSNYGQDGWTAGSEFSSIPMPRFHTDHPSVLVYFEKLPIWGGIRRLPEDYLPSSTEVLWAEFSGAPAEFAFSPCDADDTSSAEFPTWEVSSTPGDVARIELKHPNYPDADGTAIFDLKHRLCLFYELRFGGEPQQKIVVDAVRIGDDSPWRRFTDFGDPKS